MSMFYRSRKRGVTTSIYFIAFLTALHYAFVVYINSSYLENFLDQKTLGFLYVIASLITIVAISNLSRALRRWGQFKTALTILSVDLLAIISMAATSLPLNSKTRAFPVSDGVLLVENASKLLYWVPVVAIVSFLAFQITIVLNRVLLDIYLEEFSKDKETGSNRGWFLTSVNLAFVFAPFVVGRIIAENGDGFWKVYGASALFLLVAIYIISTRLNHIKDVEYESPSIRQTLTKVAKNKNIKNIYLSSLMLEFFYSWMVIYTPIYLHDVVGFEWKEIGLMFSIMLTSFVMLQLPLGKISDKYLGQKEILTAGFIIISLATAALSFIDSKSIIIWTIALFMTRVGASAIEVMNDTYFFKQVRATNSDVISFFRNMSPLAYIAGPTLASGALYLIEFRYLFLLLGTIMLLGIKFALSIEDTL